MTHEQWMSLSRPSALLNRYTGVFYRGPLPTIWQDFIAIELLALKVWIALLFIYWLTGGR